MVALDGLKTGCIKQKMCENIAVNFLRVEHDSHQKSLDEESRNMTLGKQSPP